MSEKRTTEIKLRLTEQEKLRWQAAAAEREIGLSELIRRSVNEATSLPTKLGDIPVATGQWGDTFVATSFPTPSIFRSNSPYWTPAPVASPQEDVREPRDPVGTSDEVGANEEPCENRCNPWEFCACKAKMIEQALTR